MEPSNSGNNQPRKHSPYSFPAIVGVAAVVLLILGFSIPGVGWLAWIGFLLLISAAFTMGLSFYGDWTPALFTHEKKDNLPPPPTKEQ